MSSLALALRKLESHNSPGLKEEEPPTERLRSDARKAQDAEKRVETQFPAENLNPMREVYRAPTDVSTQVHYNWGVWDLISLKENSPDPEQYPEKFIEFFLSSLRSQKANWADTRVLLQKLIPLAKYRDIMAFWDWGDDLAANPTWPKRRDGSGSIAEGLRGNEARTSALVEDIKNAFPKRPPLQQLEKCVFEKNDTAYTFMDRTREAFCQIMGPNSASAAEFRPFILNHYVTHLPPSVSQKIRATVGWESFSLDVVCAHAAHHLLEMGTNKQEKKDRLLALQIDHLNAQLPAGYTHPPGYTKTLIPYVPAAQRGGGGQQRMGSNRHPNRGGRGRGAKPTQMDKPCPRCGTFGHFARFCTAITATPGQVPFYALPQAGAPGQLMPSGLPQAQQVAGGYPPNGGQSAYNAYMAPFFQPTYPPQIQQNAAAPGHQPQQFRTA